jgi:hypothetical protein
MAVQTLATLKTRFYYPNTPENQIPEGTPILQVDDSGVLTYGQNYGWEVMAESGAKKLWGQTTFLLNLQGTMHAGRRLFLFDTTDPIDFGLRHAEGPDCLVTAPVVIGAAPGDVSVDTLGSSLKDSAWGPKGIGAGNIHAKHPQGNVNLGSFTYGSKLDEGRDFTPGAHKLLGCIGYQAYVQKVRAEKDGSLTLALSGIEFKQLPDSGVFETEDGREVCYARKNATGKPADPLYGDLLGCSGDPVESGEFVYLRVTLAAGDQLNLAINPDPQNGARYAGCRTGQSIGRGFVAATYTPDGGIVGADASPGITSGIAGWSGGPAEDLYTSKQGGEFWIFSTPLGTTISRRRLYVRTHGQVDATAGLGLGPVKTLGNPGPILDPTIREGEKVIDSRSRLVVANNAPAEIHGIALEGTIEGQQMSLRLQDANSRLCHNLNVPGRFFLQGRADLQGRKDDLFRFEREGPVWRQL